MIIPRCILILYIIGDHRKRGKGPDACSHSNKIGEERHAEESQRKKK